MVCLVQRARSKVEGTERRPVEDGVCMFGKRTRMEIVHHYSSVITLIAWVNACFWSNLVPYEWAYAELPTL